MQGSELPAAYKECRQAFERPEWSVVSAKKKPWFSVARAYGCGACVCSCFHSLLLEECSDEIRQHIARKVKTGAPASERGYGQPVAYLARQKGQNNCI
jgi:MinD superfamily P-loop ATPase